MTRRRKLLLIVAILFGSALTITPKAHAQPPPQRITCSSNNMGRNWCAVGNTRDVQLVRQISGSPCIRGQTWGTDNRGIWVDRGCRAEFIIGRGGPPQRQTITCESNNMRRNWCPIGNTRDVQLVRQLSRTPCTWRDTWGTDNRGIWVDRGCRAVFSVPMGGPPGRPR